MGQYHSSPHSDLKDHGNAAVRAFRSEADLLLSEAVAACADRRCVYCGAFYRSGYVHTSECVAGEEVAV